MPRLRVVTMDDKGGDLSPADIEWLEEGVQRLRRLVNNPIALIERAQALLEGWAEPLI